MKCPQRHTKRLDGDAAKGATTQPTGKKDDLVVQNWTTQLPNDGRGIAPTSKEDQERIEEIDALEQLIAISKKRPSKADEAKKREDELAALKKKPPANSIAKDHVALARVAKDAEEKPEKKVTGAKASLLGKMDARDNLVLNKAQFLEANEEHKKSIAPSRSSSNPKRHKPKRK